MTVGPPQPRGEGRRLSSARTERVRISGLVAASLATAVGLALLLAHQRGPALVVLAVSLVLWLRAWVGRRLSVVESDGELLLVSSQARRARIPLTEVLSVSRVWFPGAQRIYVAVAKDMPFGGREIVFEAPFEPRAIVGRHPIVEELRARVDRAQGSGPRQR